MKTDLLKNGVSQDMFREYFSDHTEEKVEKLWNKLTTRPKDTDSLWRDYFPSKLWRINNLYTITDKWGEKVPFRLNRAQFIVYSKLLLHPRLIILKSRQQGISTFFLISFFDDALMNHNMNCGLMAQDRDSAAVLLERTRHAWEDLHPEIKSHIGLKIVKDNKGQLSFNNKSNIYIKTSFRSATLQRLHISELAKIANEDPEKAEETITGSLQALARGNVGVIESTAEGKNKFFQFWETAVQDYDPEQPLTSKQFLPVFLPWTGDPDCVEDVKVETKGEASDYFRLLESTTDIHLSEKQRNFWCMQHKELKHDMYREYPATPEEAFRAPRDGAYWAKDFTAKVVNKGHIKEDIYDSNLDLYVAMDIGTAYTALVFFQVYQDQIRIVDEHHKVNKTLEYYAEFLLEYRKKRQLRNPILPHDGLVKDFSAPEDKNRQEILRDNYNIKSIVLPKSSLASGIDNVIECMGSLYIDKKCRYTIDCITNYSREWDKRNKLWKDEPKRSVYNHGADALRYAIQYCITHLIGDETSEEYGTKKIAL